MLNKFRKIYLNVGIISATTIGMALPAYAAPVKDFGEGSARVGEMSNAAMNGFLAAVGFIGVVVFVVNGYKLFFGAEQGQETKSKQFRGLIGGAFLSTPLIFLAMFTTTFSGAEVDEASLKSTIATYAPTSG